MCISTRGVVMKKIHLILFVVVTILVGCGKENSVVSGAISESLANVNPVNSQMAQALKQYRDFISQDKFVRASINYEVDLFRMEQNLEVDKCFFNLLDCTENKVTKVDLGTERRSEVYNSNSITHRYGNDRTQVRNELVRLLDQAVSGYSYGYNRFVIALTNGESYYFDLNLPLSANPVQFYNYQTNEGYVLSNGGGWYTIQ
jgi:hypothetical protein